MISKPRVAIGPASILGWAAALGGIVAAIWISVEEGITIFSGASGLPAKLAAGILVATHLGRQYQDAHLPGGDVVGEVLDELPAALQGVPTLPAPPAPDGVDGPQVAFSGADEPPAA